ncbi:hypothetical protein [Pelosinus propionicus]|uniref:Uncharacterized protein n=1 Tax=Pelosinus propionicus DSM 13327 TaxID=1123291 RepID=A0A1I4N2V0_9FIRM|nr:hypothetical protein [Pelosinus propionicus]SFM09656.1 hypothetical protein SAMN04490355_104056 [Pelosinus propionicus DSM 13327]
MSEKITAEDIRESLRKRFTRPEWALFFEVGNGTAGNLKRWADALAMNMYPSRGLAIVGFEIKVSRNDLKKELEQPKKAEAVGCFCNQWYLVVPKGLINGTDIIPAAWGILEYNNGSLRQTKKPSELSCQPITKEFVAAILRRDDEAHAKNIAQQVQSLSEQRITELRQRHEENLKAERERMSERHKQLWQSIKDFEKISGIRINSYNGEELGKAVEILQKIGITGSYSHLKAVRRNMEMFLTETEKIIQDNERGGIT